MRKVVACVVILCLFSSVRAALIEGQALGFENKYIRLYAVDDFLSYHQIKLDVVKIDSDGRFSLNGYLPKAALIKLKIEEKTAELIVLPGKNIRVALTFNEEENKNKLYDRQFTIEILDDSDGGINKLIWQYQSDNASFLDENHTLLVTKKILPEVYTFQEMMTKKYADSPDYFRNYLEYSLAALEDAVLGSEKKLFQLHLSGRSILYTNIAYMNFFAQFYQERFIQISQGKKGFQFLSAVNGTQNYSAMMELIDEQIFIDNDTLAQLFAVLGLKEVYGDETFKKIKVISMLNQIKSRAVNRTIEKIVENVLVELTLFQAGKEAPEFSLKDATAKVHHLSDYDDKPSLIFFWSAYSNAALRDLNLMAEYKNKYSEKIDFIAINVDDNPVKALNYLEANSFPFQMLFKDQQYDLTDKYRIVSGRSYALIDKGNQVIAYPAKLPEGNLEADLFKLTLEN